MATPDYMTIRYNTAAQKVSNLWKDYLPDNFSRRKVFHYISETNVDENLNFNPRARPIQWNELTKEEQIFAREVSRTFSELGDTFKGEELIFGKRSNYLPLLWQEYPGRDLFKFVSDFDDVETITVTNPKKYMVILVSFHMQDEVYLLILIKD